jgi:HlyD family secretion protein
MDIARPSNLRRKRIKQAAYALSTIAVVIVATVGLGRLKPAAPSVEASTVWPDVVKRGSMLRQVRGIGTLVPEDIRWIPASTQGRVERIILRPGTAVTADSIILELSNAQLEQEVRDAELKLEAAEAALANMRVQVQNDLLQQKAITAAIVGDHSKAQMQAEMNEELAKRQLVSELVRRQSQLDAKQLEERRAIAEQQLAIRGDAGRAQLRVQQSTLDQAKALLALKRQEQGDLRVRAGISGVLQLVSVDVGQQVAPGTNLARVANPSRLKAEIKIAETQAKDIQVGQTASVDTRNGVVPGRVIRIDPSVQNGTRTVDVFLDGELPKGAVPDLSVDGTIELERLENVLYMGRPAFGQEDSTVGIFKVDGDGVYARRVQVKLGRSSVNAIEVRDGLSVGDKVILSDMSTWDGVDRIRLK